MMTHGSKYLTGSLVVVGLLVALVNGASAVDRYGVIGLSNDTDVALNFQYREGDGAWRPGRIQAGEKLWFAHRYDRPNEHHSPLFHIRFDSDLRSGRFDIEYTLQHRAAVGQGYDYGAKYAFRYDRGDRRFVDLKRID